MTLKKILFVGAFLISMQTCFSQKVISAADAGKHVGEKVTVCDSVFGGRFMENANGQPTLVNMGAVYPNSPFTFVIFPDNLKMFIYKPEVWLVNKKVCVKGDISLFKERPQMVITDTAQVILK